METEREKITCPLCKSNPSLWCPACRGFGWVYKCTQVEKNRKRNERSLKFVDASKIGEPYTDAEIKVILNPRLSAREAAKTIGRSLKSVESMRHRLRKKGRLK